MPFTKISSIVKKIDKKEYLLPAIQREFVWEPDQIVVLFDSIMKKYPIGSFLFWEVNKKDFPKYQFYEFIREYHEKYNRHNQKANLNGEANITAILDGQQRFTSLYIGLKGSYAYKTPRKRWDNDDAFPKRELYLDLLNYSENGDYNFKFLTEEDVSEKSDEHLWFKVGEILDFKETADVNNYIISQGIYDKYEEPYARFANNTLSTLYEVINVKESVNFFLEEDNCLDEVLNIFIRVNSGGTQLTYSDLLLSVASAQWKNKDAREEITKLVDKVNKIGSGFKIDKDFVLKTCLVLSDFKDIAFRVDNFNQDNMFKIEENWDSIIDSIELSYKLLAKFGYSRDTLTSNNAVIPIAYYIHKIGNPKNFVDSKNYSEDRKQIFKYLIRALLKKVFGGQPDNVLRPLREVIKESESVFPFDKIVEKQKGTSKSFTLDDDEIEYLFGYQYGNAVTYSILAMLYPNLDFKNKFHEDHIFPKSIFTQKNLKKIGIPEEDIEFYLDNYNCIANLQLLEGIPNEEKSSNQFDEWLIETYPNEENRKEYMKKNYIPDCSLNISNFKNFIEARKKLISDEIKKMR